jgi:hypothetical protein
MLRSSHQRIGAEVGQNPTWMLTERCECSRISKEIDIARSPSGPFLAGSITLMGATSTHVKARLRMARRIVPMPQWYDGRDLAGTGSRHCRRAGSSPPVKPQGCPAGGKQRGESQFLRAPGRIFLFANSPSVAMLGRPGRGPRSKLALPLLPICTTEHHACPLCGSEGAIPHDQGRGPSGR